MRVRVILEAVFQRSPDGVISTGMPFDYAFFTRYLAVFSAVEVIARVEDVTTMPAGWRPVEGAHVRVRPLPGQSATEPGRRLAPRLGARVARRVGRVSVHTVFSGVRA